MKQGRLVLLFGLCMLLSGCLSGVWSGATLVYDRHNVYKKMSDYHLMVKVTNALFPDTKFKEEGCSIDIAVFNGDILVAGHLRTEEFLQLARNRLALVKGYRRMFDELKVQTGPADNMQDGWITARIRSDIFTDDSIDLSSFKVVTTDGVVYLMGDVKFNEAQKVVAVARRTEGVKRVVKLMKYFTYQTEKK